MRRVLMLYWVVVLASIYIPSAVHAQFPSLAQTPPMGWSSWNFFGRRITDKDIRAMADAMVASGMKDVGYEYLNIDDTWEGERDASGTLHSNAKFPDMKALADYVHSKGLKLGIYSSPGPKTCAGFEGSFGHEAQDAQTFAAWGIDYLKYDMCSLHGMVRQQAPNDEEAQTRVYQAAFTKMSNAIKASGRPMVYSLSFGGFNAPWEWAPSAGANLWRTTLDINPSWDRISANMNEQAGLAPFAGPGHWNDPDMLEVGNGKLTPAENRSHFSIWAILAAPLIAGNDLSNMTPEVRAILTNREVISIDQDKLGQEGTRIYSEGEMDVWTRHLAGGALAVAVLSTGEERQYPSFHLKLSKLGLNGPQKARDLWTGESMVLSDELPIKLGAHDVLLVRIDHPNRHGH